MPDEANARPQINMSAETIALHNKMLGNPATSKKYLRLLKEANPDAPIPVVEMEDQITAIQTSADKKVGELAHTVNQLQASITVKDQQAWLRSRGLSDEDVTAVEKLMQEQGITNYAIAHDVFRYRRQLAAPTPPLPTRKPITENISKEALEGAAKGDLTGITQETRSGAYADMEAFNRRQANAR